MRFRYITVDGEEHVLVDAAALVNAVKSGTIQPDHLVWDRHSDRWRPAREHDVYIALEISRGVVPRRNWSQAIEPEEADSEVAVAGGAKATPTGPQRVEEVSLSPFAARVPRRIYAPWALITGIAGAALNLSFDSAVLGVWTVLVLLLVVPSIAASVGRLHDLNMNGWWLLLAFIPIANVVLGIYMFFARGTVGVNRFGSDPRSPVLPEPDGAAESERPPPIRYENWDGGAVRPCPACGLANPEQNYRCTECDKALSGVLPFYPDAEDLTGPMKIV